jgi:CRP/FNR family transcriptional regulator, cyclic AMP receptor protein
VSSYFSYPLADGETPNPLRFLPSRPPRDWERIDRYAERLRFSAGDVIVREGDRDTSFAIVLSGSLAVDLPWAPRVETGSVFGEIAFLTGAPRSATVRAEADGELLRMSRDAFDVLAARHPELGRSIALELGRIVAERLLREQPSLR